MELNRKLLTVLTIVMIVVTVGTALATAVDISPVSLIGFVLALVLASWVIGGCARRGEPVAVWLMRWVPYR